MRVFGIPEEVLRESLEALRNYPVLEESMNDSGDGSRNPLYNDGTGWKPMPPDGLYITPAPEATEVLNRARARAFLIGAWTAEQRETYVTLGKLMAEAEEMSERIYNMSGVGFRDKSDMRGHLDMVVTELARQRRGLVSLIKDKAALLFEGEAK